MGRAEQGFAAVGAVPLFLRLATRLEISAVATLARGYERSLFSALAVALALVVPGEGIAAPTLFGTDEDSGHLVRIEEYLTTRNVTDYGLLSVYDDGVIRPFPDTDPAASDVFSDIESFALNDQGVAFMVGNGSFSYAGGSTFTGPQLYSMRVFNLDGSEAVQIDDGLASGGHNVLMPLGAVSGIDAGSVINGIDFDPLSGLLFGVVENGGRDDLIAIDTATAEATILATSMEGTDDIEDIQFDPDGRLYLIDDDGGLTGSEDVLHLATLDRSGILPTLLSISVINHTGDNHRVEALGWDFQNEKLLAFSDTSNSLFDLSITGDGFIDLGSVGFNDMEGFDAVPTQSGLPIPEPSTATMLGLGLALLAGCRKLNSSTCHPR